MKRLATTLALASLTLASCQSTGSFFSFSFGSVDRRAELMEAVHDAHDDQVVAHQELSEAFALLGRIIKSRPDAETLADLFEDYVATLEDCDEVSRDFSADIVHVRNRGDELFAEWTAQLRVFSNGTIRAKSMEMLEDTQKRHRALLASLELTETRMRPVLLSLQDYETFFVHNLNPRGIATLDETYSAFLQAVASLDTQLRASREQTERFLEIVEGIEVPSTLPPPSEPGAYAR